MHRIDGPGATPQNTFTEGDPQQAIPATVVTDDFLNAVQEEIVDVILTAGLALSKPDNTQLRQAVLAMIAASIPDTSNFVAKTGAQSMAGPLTVTGAVTAAPDSLIKNQGAGLPDRGGRLLLEKPVNGTLASNIAVEVGADGVPNRARIGETGGTNRGVFFDLSKAGAGVTSDANFIVAESLGANGYRKYSDDLIVQWGVSESFGNIAISQSATVTYPISFPNTFFVVIPMIENFDGVFEEFAVFNRSASSISQGVFVAREATAAAQSSWRFSYIAIGN